MDQHGVDVRPLRQITGEAEFNEIFMEDAEIPDENSSATWAAAGRSRSRR